LLRSEIKVLNVWISDLTKQNITSFVDDFTT